MESVNGDKQTPKIISSCWKPDADGEQARFGIEEFTLSFKNYLVWF
jgi:hypothetical protein